MKYHKIQSIYKRDPANKRLLLEGQFSLPEFEFLQYNDWSFTEKVDGMNMRIIFDGSATTFRGKTDRAQIPQDLLTRLFERFTPQLERFKNIFPEGVCLYGEGYGPKIQKGGGNYRADQDFVLFDINVHGWWLRREDVESIALQLGLDVAPVIGAGTLHHAVEIVKNGFKSTWGDFTAEGMVARPVIELKARNGERIITKIKHRDFEREDK